MRRLQITTDYMSSQTKKHPNDIYGDIEKRETDNPAIPAATVMLMRNTEDSTEILMLRKNSKYAFGGMWVFPGGAIEDQDRVQSSDDLSAAQNAAVRESKEEANISLDQDKFVWFSHWTPPASTPKRFATWFFLAGVSDSLGNIEIDDEEIKDHQWISPRVALERHAANEIDLAPPTWVTLYHLSQFNSVEQALESRDGVDPRFYETHLAKSKDGTRVAMWAGDAGYSDYDADLEGATHRLVMNTGNFSFLHSAVDYG